MRSVLQNGHGEKLLGFQSVGGIESWLPLFLFVILFGLSSDQAVQQLGVGLGVAILIDATLVRAVLLPATMKLLGERNWWLPERLHWLPESLHEEAMPAPASPDRHPSKDRGARHPAGAAARPPRTPFDPRGGRVGLRA